MSDYSPQAVWRRGETSLFIGFVLIFIGVFTALFLLPKSLRLDEAQSLWQTSHSVVGVLRILAQDVHLPLYFLSLRTWETLFGSTPLAIRTFSLLFLLASIPLFFLLADRAFGRTAAFVTVLLAMSSPFLLWYGSEGRMYTLLLFFTILNQFAFLKLWTRGEKSEYWGLYAVSAILGAFTHYFFLFVLLGQAIFYLANRSLFPQNALRHFVGTAGSIVLGYGLWLFYRSTVGEVNADPYLTRPTSFDVFNTFTNFVFGFQNDWVNTLLLSLWPIFVLGICALLVRSRRILPEAQYFIIAALLPVALAFGISVTLRPLFLSRYLIVALPATYVLLAHFILLYRRSASTIIAGVLVAVMQGALFLEAMSPDVRVNEEYREAAEYVEGNIHPDDLFVVSAPFTRYPLEYYYQGSARLATFPVWERYLELPVIPSYKETELAASLKNWQTKYTTLYVLTSYDQGYEKELRLFLDEHVERLETREFSPGLTLSVYRLRYL